MPAELAPWDAVACPLCNAPEKTPCKTTTGKPLTLTPCHTARAGEAIYLGLATPAQFWEDAALMKDRQ